ncbi:PEP-CTERM protein-sorting domain-containing protein [Roseateles sp. YR242]|uniref:hypothetical protein n=1 Tax=Roseateles sp. YR242 TaxID=1855305 RepID=UPI0008BB413D|nr:hypothetical protein [Roseateles sp. YR242]SEL52625.1 PEP-CTERM protein-sorting domain-containing protein [Roseateles sp. YR242]
MNIGFSSKALGTGVLAPLLAMLAMLAAMSLALPAKAQNLVTNGGFETGDLTGWSGTVLANPYSGVYCPGAGGAPEGSCEAFLGTAGSSDTISQMISTVAGQLYTVSFSFQSDGSTPSSLLVSFGNQAAYSLLSPVSTDLHSYTFSGLATGASTELLFNFRNDPGYFIVDGISVSAVPEPASFALCLAGVLGLAMKRRWTLRRR